MSHRIESLAFTLLLALAPGCSEQADASGTGGASAGGAGGNDATSEDASDSSAETCPTAPPAEGSACATPGLDCPVGGALSCPLRAKCDPSGAWRITCPTHAFGSDVLTCSCPHPGG